MTSNSIGFVYPGQGAQKVGMGADLCDAYPFARKRFQEADNFLGFSLQNLCIEGPPETLAQDLNAQLGIYTISTIVTDLLKTQGLVPDLCTGYSSGFYAAAYAAGCFDFLTGLSIVKRAGKILLKQGQSCNGGMAIIFGLPHEQVLAISRKVGHVDIAIHNTPRQIVISGLKPGIEAVMAEAMREGALDTNWLPTTTAYHSRFMADAGKSLREEIDRDDLSPPQISLYSYATTQPVMDRDALINIMAMQLSHPVLWVDLIRKLEHIRVNTLVEIGPGTMLSRSIRWINRHIAMLDTSSVTRIQGVVNRLTYRDHRKK
jgi:[acyl-carrier-protein] S-malonyltransferase